MEPLLIILVPGLFGGLVLALLLAVKRKRAPAIVVPRRLAAPSPGLINIAHIPVEGVGGLGMVAAVVAVAVTDPRIRFATIVAAVLGAGLALVLIALRQSNGAGPSIGDGPDDRSILHIFNPAGPTDTTGEHRHTPVTGVQKGIERVKRGVALGLPRTPKGLRPA
jgi:hypothetical protein